ncbi:hypothetical protein MNBD_GAMMA11-3002 [hydrothermal vent metagenome]|uniref:Uncharacterized protein n=1 Tax=hydrothermal vent metagenome TaxID=652676 RepID=A0A3B0WSM1_9ZZZZ
MQKTFELSLTTQGPTYPPSEVMNENGDYVVIGRINREADNGKTVTDWGHAIVSPDSYTPDFGKQSPYEIVEEINYKDKSHNDMILCTLPLPLSNNNYPMVFAPEQLNDTNSIKRSSIPFHEITPPDTRREDGLREMPPITLGQWIKAKGNVTITVSPDKHHATFEFEFNELIPDSLYTIMSLREWDLDPEKVTRPGPLGIPNVFITDTDGNGHFWAKLPNPFPSSDQSGRNRVINVILLWMSNRMSHGGAIGLHGLGGDVHAQLKMKGPSFFELETC